MIKNRKLAVLSMSAIIALSNMRFVFADSSNVVTLGTNLSDTQKQQVLKYFGVEENEAVIIEVNNQQERKYLEGVIPDAQIGTKTYSCAYVEPTNTGKINVKTVNLSYVNSNMISSAFATATSGMSANIVAISPFVTSGTGSLVGVLLATEDATGEPLDEDKKEIATEEMIVTGDIGKDIGQDKATGIVNDIKTEIIKNNTKDTVQIAETINNVTNNYNVTLNTDQTKQLEELMQKISEQDYNYKEMKDALNNIAKDVDKKLDAIGESVKTGILDTVKGWFEGFGEWVSGIFSGNEDLGILETTNDTLLGENAQIDATNENAIQLPSSEEVQGFFAKIWNTISNFFSNLFSKVENVENNNNTEVEEPLFNDTTEADFEIMQEEESQADAEVNNVNENVQVEENKVDSNVEENTVEDNSSVNENVDESTQSNDEIEE